LKNQGLIYIFQLITIYKVIKIIGEVKNERK